MRWLIALLVIAAVWLVAADCTAPARPARDEFQHLVGGLGLGPAVDLSRCGFSFDARLCPECPAQHGPLPGGVYYCPQHACSILYVPPVGRDDGRSR
jgi:hypothetical protein